MAVRRPDVFSGGGVLCNLQLGRRAVGELRGFVHVGDVDGYSDGCIRRRSALLIARGILAVSFASNEGPAEP